MILGMFETWQDAVLSVAAVVFLLALLPSNVDRSTRISRRTSVPTAVAVWVQAATLWTLGLTFTAVVTFGIAACWTHIAVARAFPVSSDRSRGPSHPPRR